MAQTNQSRTGLLKERVRLHQAGKVDDAALKRGLAQAKCDRNYLILSGEELEAAAIAWLFQMTKGADADVMMWVMDYAQRPGFEEYMNGMMMSAFYR